uniref:Uncharacterized protein TCIL3000_10_5200 n=1 Tax=Trypanosoma congolense (strain IL3000) TaxID=1068625 RepID=G0UWI9_TRYCI|nr:unnamed protein product [Trypanosoma congolense IL3000]
MNSNKVRFGCRQDGRPMDALELPPWAHGDPYEFVYRMREALESDYVSLNLHHWIDLIFGYKQRGKDAISALNVFNWHSYEDLDKNHTGNVDQKLLIDSLDNIGQTPIQLFTKPHGERCAVEWVDPLRCTLDMKTVAIHAFCARVARVAILDHERVLVMCGNGTILLYRLLVSPVMRRVERSLNAHRAASSPTCNANSANANGSFSGKHSTGAAVSSVVAQASSYLLGMVSGTASSVSPRELADNTAFQRPSLDIVEEFEQRVPPLPLGMIPNTDEKSGGPCETENVAVLSLGNEVFVAIGGLFDNSIMIRHLTSTIAIPDERLHAHYDRVVLVAASADSKYLVSGAEDTTFIVWSCHYQRQMEKPCIELLFAVYGHEDNPTAVSVCPAVDIVATASRDGVLMLHSLSNCRLERSLRHPSRFSIDRVLIQASCYLPNILYTSAVDNVIHQVSINGVTLRSVAAPGRITGWCTTPKQSLLITTAPLTNTSASEEGCGMLHFMHAFYLNVVKSVQCPLFTPGDTLATCAVHALNPQIVVCGSAHGTLSLLRLVSPPE